MTLDGCRYSLGDARVRAHDRVRLPAGDPGHAAARAGARVRLAVLHRRARRRPAAVAAPVLVLRPSGRLHHLPARRRHGLDDRADDGADAARRLPLVVVGACRRWARSASGCGCTTCSPPGCPSTRCASSRRPAWPSRSRAASRSSPGSPRSRRAALRLDHADLFVLGFFFIFVLGGLTGVMVAVLSVRLAGARHLFRRRAPALRADRRHGVPAVRGASTTGRRSSAGARCPSARRAGCSGCMFARRQPRVLPDAHHRPARHAAPRLHVSGGLGWEMAEPDLDARAPT